jgi:hypothetical protein
LALLADAGHMLTDSTGLVIACAAQNNYTLLYSDVLGPREMGEGTGLLSTPTGAATA